MEKPVAASARKILLVDDNRVIRHLLRLTFADSLLFQVFEADSGEKALPIVLREQPEIIILDVLMPGELNGFQICHMIKSWQDTRHCKIILLSAKSQQDDLEQGRQAGADYYVTKPFSPTELIRLVNEA
jgi:CheY-like chemotaxis protein